MLVLHHVSIFTITSEHDFRGTPSGHRNEGKWWKTGKEAFDEAARAGARLPVLFADAAHDCSRLFAWAVLDSIQHNGSGTSYTFSECRPLTGATQELLLTGTSEPIKPGFIRPYAICHTPWFVFYTRTESRRSSEARAWVLKGRPSRNELNELLEPGRIDRWETNKAPKDWASGDFLFCWRSSPGLEIAGLARIRQIFEESGSTTEFDVEYLTGPLTYRVGLADLRADTLMNSASFTKSGPVSTLYPLSPAETSRLARMVLEEAPSCRPVFDDHLLASGRVRRR